MRLGKVVSLTSDYEIEAVVGNDYTFGGWRNTALPNFVYRWTESEVLKTIASFDPSAPVSASFFYGLRLPIERLAMGTSIKSIALKFLALPIRTVFAIAKRQGNEFAFCITKPTQKHPWLQPSGGLNRDWLDRRYHIAQITEKVQHFET